MEKRRSKTRKMSADFVREARRRWLHDGIGYLRLAGEAGVSRTAVVHAVLGRTYGDVPGVPTLAERVSRARAHGYLPPGGAQ